MKIIFRKDFDLYRMVVGKLAFLAIHDDYKLVRNIDYSNAMLLEDRRKNYFYACIFRQPNVRDLEEFPIRIYYQRQSFKANVNRIIKKYERMPNSLSLLNFLRLSMRNMMIILKRQC